MSLDQKSYLDSRGNVTKIRQVLNLRTTGEKLGKNPHRFKVLISKINCSLCGDSRT